MLGVAPRRLFKNRAGPEWREDTVNRAPCVNKFSRNEKRSRRQAEAGGPKRPVSERSARVRLDRDAVVHLVDAQNLGVAAVAAELVVLAHDQRLDRLGGADLRAKA